MDDRCVTGGLPGSTRVERTDAAMAARAECVMLNKSPCLPDAIDALDRLLGRTSVHQYKNKKAPQLRALTSRTGDLP